MGILRSLTSGLAALAGKDKRNGEIDDELQAYVRDAVDDRVRRGMSETDAMRAVRAEVGSVEIVKHRVWSAGWESTAERLWKDVGYTMRRLRRTPGLVFAVVLSIGLGIAANATIFSLVSKFVLKPAPVGDAKTLITLYQTHDNENCCNNLTAPEFRDLRDGAQSFSGVSAYNDMLPASIGGSGEPEQEWGQAASTNYFDVAQVGMALGRGFTAEEERAPVIVLGYRLWQRHFAGDGEIVGKAVTISGHLYTVVGVAPLAFRGLDLVLDPQFWVPLGDLPELAPDAPDAESRENHWLRVAARLKPGVTEEAAKAELAVLARRMTETHPATDKGNGFHVEPAGALPPRDGGAFRLFLLGLSVVALLVLAIACANVANLLLAQGAQRQREMAVRLAMGATRGQLLRQMLIESVVLAMGGGVVGVLLSVWATVALSSFHLPIPIPADLTLSVDWRVLVYSFGLSLVAGTLCGSVPAWAASRPMLTNALKGEDALARPGRAWSLRNVLVVGQITVSLVLLCAAGLFLRSLQGAVKIDSGFRSRGVLSMGMNPMLHRYTPVRTVQFLNAVRDRVGRLPGVISTTTTDAVPLSMGHRSEGFVADGQPKPMGENVVEIYMAGPGYFETMGIARLAGREFGNENPDGPKVAIVSQEFVKRFFQGRSPVGARVHHGKTAYEIVGVVKDTKSRTIGENQRPVLYRSLEQSVAGDPSSDGYAVMAHYEGDATALAGAMRGEVHALDPTMAIYNMQTMEEHMRDALFLPRLVSTIFCVFGGLGLLLATVGLYGVMSYSVSQRTKEIGIRMALGARVGAVQEMVVRGGMRMALLAVGLGIPLALGAAKLATSLLYGVRPYDLATFTAVPVLLIGVSLMACWIPSRRASRVDPMVALRVD